MTPPTEHGRSSAAACAGALVLVAAIILAAFVARPHYNWDILPYVAIAKRIQGKSPLQAPRETYAEARALLPDKTFTVLSSAEPYRRAVAANASYFNQQLPLYSVKPLYPVLMLAVSVVGVDLFTASLVISKAAFVGILLLLFVWIARHTGAAAAGLLTLLLGCTPFVLGLARFSSPDALSVLMVLSALYLLIERQKETPALLLLALSVTARPDNVMLLVLIVGRRLWLDRHGRRWVLGSLALGLGLWAATSLLSGNYGWRVLFHHTFIERTPALASAIPSETLADYLACYAFFISPANIDSQWIFFVFVTALGTLLHRRHGSRIWIHFLVINIVFMVLHWLALPIEKDRTLAASYLIGILGIVSSLRPRPHPPAEKRR